MIIFKEKGSNNPPQETSFEALRTKLREDLDERFSDVLINAIVGDFLENETLRLKASEYKVTAISPINIEYKETLRELNSHIVLLSRWEKSAIMEHDQRVSNLLKDYEEALDSFMAYPSPFYLFHGNHEDKYGNPIKIEIKNNNPIARDVYNQPAYFLKVISNIDGSTKYYAGPWPEKYCFYYTALLVLLKSYSKKDVQKNGKRGKVDTLGLNIADYATILFYATIAEYYLTDNIEAERAKFIKKHNVQTDPVNFKSAVSDIQDLQRRRVAGRLNRIKRIVEEYYPNAVERMVQELSIPRS